MEQGSFGLGLMIDNNTLLILNSAIKSMVLDKSASTLLNIDEKMLKKVLFFLKLHTNSQYKLLLDIYSVDYPQKKSRFEITYMLLSVLYNSRIFIKINTYQDQMVDSVMDIYSSANWLEREIWDMFGIFFTGHKDLRKILTDYGFEGFPLRKDFPLTGYLHYKYDDENQTVISEPVELTQEFRNFEYTMPWTENQK
jgi:NADH/F420H2 dehydrogenase subunit C